MLFTSNGTQSELIFDAKTMVVRLHLYDARTGRNFSYVQDSAMVTVQLGQLEFQEGDTLVLGISFVSTPPQRGLYFVNPSGEDPVKPTQIWTLGQPEDNSFWFPTIDHPAERATQETWISVPDRFQTLSNGLLA
jgi:aminopeptidase N